MLVGYSFHLTGQPLRRLVTLSACAAVIKVADCCDATHCPGPTRISVVVDRRTGGWQSSSAWWARWTACWLVLRYGNWVQRLAVPPLSRRLLTGRRKKVEAPIPRTRVGYCVVWRALMMMMMVRRASLWDSHTESGKSKQAILVRLLCLLSPRERK